MCAVRVADCTNLHEGTAFTEAPLVRASNATAGNPAHAPGESALHGRAAQLRRLHQDSGLRHAAQLTHHFISHTFLP